mmetsp:Transcript_23241/g.26649  ORF Transcript_23241/g.26649 Transcript_23241/m.26649 type:complete len:95 (+) Transcript_23241:670-954(+)
MKEIFNKDGKIQIDSNDLMNLFKGFMENCLQNMNSNKNNSYFDSNTYLLSPKPNKRDLKALKVNSSDFNTWNKIAELKPGAQSPTPHFNNEVKS